MIDTANSVVLPEWLIARLFDERDDDVQTFYDSESMYRVNMVHEIVLHETCGEAFESDIPARPKEQIEWEPYCRSCYNSHCTSCGAAHFDPAVETGDDNDADGVCGACWSAAMARD